MELVLGVLAFLGATGITGGFILFMIMKKGWSWAQFVAAFIFTMIVAGSFPQMPKAVNNGVTNIIQSVTSNK